MDDKPNLTPADLAALKIVSILRAKWAVGSTSSTNHDAILPVLETLALGNEADSKPTHQHKKGGLYRVLFHGKIEADLAPVVIYQAQDLTVWVRPSSEFYDGRFTVIDHDQEAP